MYNAGRQYGLGSARQRNIRDRTKSIMGRYAEKIDSYFSKRGVDVYGNKPISRRVYMGNNNGLNYDWRFYTLDKECSKAKPVLCSSLCLER